MRMWFNLILIVVLSYLGIALFLYLYQDRMVFVPHRGLEATPATVGLTFEDVELTTEDGIRVHGWYLPAPHPAPTLLFFHGNAGNISHRLASLQIFHQLGVNTLIIDYRGFGRSEGRPSEQGTYHDATAAWRYLTETRKTPAGEIVIFGRSLGGAVAAWLAERVSPRALILESAFLSIPEVGAESYPFLPVRLLSRFKYETGRHVAAVQVPVLIAHSPDDEVIGFRHGETLFRMANPPKQFLRFSGPHNGGFLDSGESYTGGLAAFLASLGTGSPDTPTATTPQRGEPILRHDEAPLAARPWKSPP
jgi:uncharacterized protein